MDQEIQYQVDEPACKIITILTAVFRLRVQPQVAWVQISAALERLLPARHLAQMKWLAGTDQKDVDVLKAAEYLEMLFETAEVNQAMGWKEAKGWLPDEVKKAIKLCELTGESHEVTGRDEMERQIAWRRNEDWRAGSIPEKKREAAVNLGPIGFTIKQVETPDLLQPGKIDGNTGSFWIIPIMIQPMKRLKATILRGDSPIFVPRMPVMEPPGYSSKYHQEVPDLPLRVSNRAELRFLMKKSKVPVAQPREISSDLPFRQNTHAGPFGVHKKSNLLSRRGKSGVVQPLGINSDLPFRRSVFAGPFGLHKKSDLLSRRPKALFFKPLKLRSDSLEIQGDDVVPPVETPELGYDDRDTSDWSGCGDDDIWIGMEIRIMDGRT